MRALRTSTSPRRLGAEMEKIESKIEALFSKAASTEFEAERESLISKALELAAKYGLEAHAIRSKSHPDERPTVRELYVKAPYMEQKIQLLQVLSVRQGCRVLVTTRGGRRLTGKTQIIGYKQDSEIVEVLYESLKNQAVLEMMRQAKEQPSYVDLKRFKKSFLYGYILGVDSKFKEIDKLNELSDSSKGLVLDRSQKVDELANELSGGKRKSSSPTLDAKAYHSGKSSGSNSDLGLSRIGNSRRALTA